MHRAPVSRWPGNTLEHSTGPLVILTGNTEKLANDKCNPGHPGGAGGKNHLGAGADYSLFLCLDTDHETRFIGEVYHRQVEGVAQLQETDYFLTGGNIHRAAELHGIINHHTNRIAINPPQSRDA